MMRHPKSIIALIAIAIAYIVLACVASAATTVTVPEGVLSSIPLRSNTTYIGKGVGKSIVRNSSTAPFSYSAKGENIENVTIIGITFDDNGLYLGNINGLTMRDCEIRDARRTKDNHQAIYFTGLRNAVFERVAFRNVSHAVMGYGSNNVTFRECLVEDSGYGIKVQLSNGSRNLLIERTIFRRMQATMGIEIQGDDPDIDGVTVRDCAYILPSLNDDDNRNKHAFAWSLPMARARNVLVERCYVDGTDTKGRRSTPQFKGVRIAHEVGGTGPIHRNNWVRFVNDPGAITTSTAAQCYDNRIESCLEGWNFASPANGVGNASAGARVENNGPNVQLPADGGWSLVGVAVPGTPVPTPPPDDTAALKSRIAELEQNAAKNAAEIAALKAWQAKVKAAVNE